MLRVINPSSGHLYIYRITTTLLLNTKIDPETHFNYVLHHFTFVEYKDMTLIYLKLQNKKHLRMVPVKFHSK